MTNAIVPVSKCAVEVRPATINDIAFMDELQKLHQKMLGFMPRPWFEGKIAAGHVIVAESDGQRVGYAIAQDKYMGRDDVGIFYQVNVKPVNHRNLIGATLVRAAIDRAAYGCRLMSCWCAQDIEANHFWESLGFVPLAFRAGNRAKSRIHIFWQRRIRENDGVTPYWFPSETRAGMMGEARLVLPIPPGTHWSDCKPSIYPNIRPDGTEEPKLLPGEKKPRVLKPKPLIVKKSKQFGPPGTKPTAEPVQATAEKPKREKKPKMKNDPKYVAAARELRDRWLEKVSEDPALLLPVGKYEVSRALPAMSAVESVGPADSTTLIAGQPEVKLLEAA